MNNDLKPKNETILFLDCNTLPRVQGALSADVEHP